MEDMEKKLKELQETVANLRETLDARDSSQREKEADVLVAKVIEKMKPPQKREMQWAIPDEKGQVPENGIHLTQFLKAITPGKEHKVSEEVTAHIKTTLEGGTDSLGGYLVPEEFSNEIIRIENDEAIIRGLARLFPMGTDTRHIPKQLTSVSVSWTDEGAVKTETNPTFSRLTQTAKKLAAVVKLTDELLEDETVGIDRLIQELVAEAIALEEDRVAFVGNTGSSDPFDGILYATGVNSVTMDGANVIFDDIIDLLTAVNSKYRAGGTLVTSTDGLKLIMKLKDSNNNYLWSPPTQVTPAQVWGYPYKVSDQIPSNLGGGTNETAIFFGNWKKHYFVSDRGGLEVKSSISASDIVNSQSAFMEDETWFRFKKRMSLDVANAAAFSKMQIK